VTTPRRVAIYARVSSEDQAERGTVGTQLDELERRLVLEADVVIVERYVDENVSGMISMEDRQHGSRLLRDAAAGRFSEVWAFKIDRLGRREQDLFRLADFLERNGVGIMTVAEGAPRGITFGMHVLMSAHYRREFMRTTSAGIARTARDGRYTGGVVAYGYRSEGEKEKARIVPDATLVWEDQSAADVVRRIYRWLGVEAWSCRQVAEELNVLGVPTHYARTGRGVRGIRTRGIWLPGRVRNMVVNPVYKGDLLFGRRIDQRKPWTEKRGHEIVAARIEPLVAPELWQATQETLARNRVCAKNARRVYPLRGVMRCATCGLTYVGSRGRNSVCWYRCNGQLVERGPHRGRCPNPSVRSDLIEEAVWADVERFLRDPGDILAELDGGSEQEAARAITEADSVILERLIERLAERRRNVLHQAGLGKFSDADVDAELTAIAAEQVAAERRMGALRPADELVAPETVDLLGQLRRHLDAGLSDAERQEIVRHLVRIVVHPGEPTPGGRTRPRVVVEYRFPGVVETRTGIREELNYTVARRVIELPVGRRRSVVGAR
jgi:site-specific DNA recombinase